MDLEALRSIVGGTPLPDVDTCRRELEQAGRALPPLGRRGALGRRARKVRSRKKICDDVPEVGQALANGDTTGDRVDVLARATQGLSPAELERVAEHGALLAAAATHGNDRQFKEAVQRVVGRARDDDGLDALARQRRNTRLRWWTGDDGMWHLVGRFDPVRGAELEGRLRSTLESLFHRSPPDDAPSDPLERQDHLAAIALYEQIFGRGTGQLVADVVVLIDEATLLSGHRHEHSVIDAGVGRFGLPIETVRRWACCGTVTPVVTAADGVRIFLGRETRLANRAQRRALRVLYRACALCDTPFEHTQMHHVAWYTLHSGPTDIDNLVPLCDRHHHFVHEGGWRLHLAPDRTLTVTLPDGRTTIHGPPRARAA